MSYDCHVNEKTLHQRPNDKVTSNDQNLYHHIVQIQCGTKICPLFTDAPITQSLSFPMLSGP